MIFSKSYKRSFPIWALCLLMSAPLWGQRAQRVGYIDMEYILENVPEYKKAEQTLNAKILKWRTELDKLTNEIEKLKTDLTNEREILTASLIADKEDEIELKQKELRKKEEEYFGPAGTMYLYRKQIIYPVQDQVYNAIQDIAKRQKYDFILDKSSDLIMLYSNKKYDISELVLRSIGVKRKRDQRNDLRKGITPDNLSEDQKKKIANRQAAEKKKQDERAAQKKRIEDARAKRKAAIEAKRKLLREKKEAARKKKEGKKKEQEKQEENNNK